MGPRTAMGEISGAHRARKSGPHQQRHPQRLQQHHRPGRQPCSRPGRVQRSHRVEKAREKAWRGCWTDHRRRRLCRAFARCPGGRRRRWPGWPVSSCWWWCGLYAHLSVSLGVPEIRTSPTSTMLTTTTAPTPTREKGKKKRGRRRNSPSGLLASSQRPLVPGVSRRRGQTAEYFWINSYTACICEFPPQLQRWR